MELNQKTKRKLIRLIHAILPECKIYLFGSFAKGTPTVSSDIDLAIDAQQKLERHVLAEVKDILSASNIIQKVDIVDLNAINNEFKSAIMKDAILWTD